MKKKDFLNALLLMDRDSLVAECNDKKKQLLRCRIQHNYKNTSDFSSLRKDVARVLTIVEQKKRKLYLNSK